MTNANQSRRIAVAEMAPHVHSFSYGENKVNKITDWMSGWIEKSLKEGKIKPYDYLPLKSELAFHIGVSLGTMQNVFRCLEDRGLVESKQRKGTYIKDRTNNSKVEKLTSKREHACELIKIYLKDNGFKRNDVLISTRKLGDLLGIPSTTVRVAINTLITDGIIRKEKTVFIVNNPDFNIVNKCHKSLVEKIGDKIKKYIAKNLTNGGKLPPNPKLAEMFNVSVKTIHDSVKLLSEEGIVKTRRGNYGTVVAEESKTELYFYESAELKIKRYIKENCEIGSKLPAIREFADMFGVSPKTIKNALDNMAEDGYVTFTRGRYGGTFVTDKPAEESGYTWLALSPGYEKKNEN